MDVKIYRSCRSNRRNIFGFIFEMKKHILTTFMFLFASIGLASGAVIVREFSDASDTIKDIFINYITSLSGQTILKIFTTQLIINVSGILLFFISGLCAVGFPVPSIFLFIKGVSIGALSSYLYSEQGLTGFGFCMTVFFPVQILMMLLLILSGKECTFMSTKLLKALTEQNTRTTDNFEIKKYLLRFILSIALATIISFISAVLNVYVIKLFDF